MSKKPVGIVTVAPSGENMLINHRDPTRDGTVVRTRVSDTTEKGESACAPELRSVKRMRLSPVNSAPTISNSVPAGPVSGSTAVMSGAADERNSVAAMQTQDKTINLMNDSRFMMLLFLLAPGRGGAV
jgi:hypothetical protein